MQNEHGELVDIFSLKITKWQKNKTLNDLKGKCWAEREEHSRSGI